MALLPKCSFRLLLPGGVVTAGERFEGTLVLVTPEAVPNARLVQVDFRTTVKGTHRQDSFPRREDLFAERMGLALPDGLAAGEHRVAVAFDVPRQLPPQFEGDGFAIEHSFAVRVSVDWRIDPTQEFSARVVPAPVEADAHPVLFRSPPSFHEKLLLEVALDSDVVSVSDPLRGKIALRSGFDVKFDALEITLVSATTSTLFDGVRTTTLAVLSIAATALRGGEDVPFVLPPNAKRTPTFDTRLLAHGLSLDVRAVGVRWRNPTVSIPVRLLPSGSAVRSAGTVKAVLGRGRIEHHAASMARVTGFRMGTGDTLVEGTLGHVGLRIDHVPRDGDLAVYAVYRFPPLDLGLRFSPPSVLDKVRASVPLPQALADRYVLRSETPVGVVPLEDAVIRDFAASIFDEVLPSDEVTLSDDELGIHRILTVDTTDEVEAIGVEMKARAERIAEAVAKLPFSALFDSDGASAWRATAVEQEAFLVPHVPALYGFALRARTLAGETRSVPVAIRTTLDNGKRVTFSATLDLRELPLPSEARSVLDEACKKASSDLAAVWTVFPSIVVAAQSITLTSLRYGKDPRDAFAALQVLFDWILAARGERKATSPYR